MSMKLGYVVPCVGTTVTSVVEVEVLKRACDFCLQAANSAVRRLFCFVNGRYVVQGGIEAFVYGSTRTCRVAVESIRPV